MVITRGRWSSASTSMLSVSACHTIPAPGIAAEVTELLPACGPHWSYREPARIEIPSLPDWRKTRLLDVQCGPLGNSKWKSLLEIQHYPISETACRQTETSTVGPSVFRQILRRNDVPTHLANGSDRGPAVRRYQFRRNPQ